MAPEPGGSSALGPNQRPGGQPLDVVFPVLHGTFGEDGTIQGLFELAGIAYVGSGVLGSSAGMDKDVMKRLFAQAPTAHRQARNPAPRRVGKVSAQGHRAGREGAQVSGLRQAREPRLLGRHQQGARPQGTWPRAHSRRPLRPQAGRRRRRRRQKTKARELEVAVLGNDAPQASVVGEIIPGKEFYDYEAKYLSEGSVPVIPAKLTKAQTKQVREMAVAAFRACDLSGLARVDFLMEPDGKQRIFLNEVNTMPGFTRISMYPKLWDATGLSYKASSPASSNWPLSAMKKKPAPPTARDRLRNQGTAKPSRCLTYKNDDRNQRHVSMQQFLILTPDP